MQNIIKNWNSCKEVINGRTIALFLDFDGTLSPIAPTPDEAIFPNENRILLQKLSNHKTCVVTVISGRSIENLKNKLRMNNLVYCEPYR